MGGGGVWSMGLWVLLGIKELKLGVRSGGVVAACDRA